MALKDLTADLENFKYGMSSPEQINNQIEKGVDFFPNDDASGFTPKTDLESLYNKVQDGTFGKTWPEAARSNVKARTAYGTFGEYNEAGSPGLSNPSHIFSSDTTGTPWSVDFPQFQSPFMTTPIADYVSRYPTDPSVTWKDENGQMITPDYGPGAVSGFPPRYYADLKPIGTRSTMWSTSTGTYTHYSSGTKPPDNDNMQSPYKNYPYFGKITETQTTLYDINQPGNTAPFKITNQPGGYDRYSPFQPLPPYDFMTNPISNFVSRYPTDPSVTWGDSDGTMTILDTPFVPISYDKQRGVFDEYLNLNFENNDSSIDGGSIHISPGGQIEAGLRYGALKYEDSITFENFEQGTALTDVTAPLWETFSQHSNFMNPLALHNSRFVDRVGNWGYEISDPYPTSITWTADGGLMSRGVADAIVAGNPSTNSTNAGEQPSFLGGETLASLHGVEGTAGGPLSNGQYINNDKLRYGKFSTKGENGYNEVPSGMMGISGLFGTKSYREVADPGTFGMFRQPFILREMGDQWGIDPINYETDIGGFFGDSISEFVSGFFRGAPTFTGLVERNIVDKIRLGKFLLTPAGIGFIGKQYVLQGLNPIIETKVFNPLSTLNIPIGVVSSTDNLADATIGGLAQLLASIALPIAHTERHAGGYRYEKKIQGTSFLTDSHRPVPEYGNSGYLAIQSMAFDERQDIDIRVKRTNIGFIDNFIDKKVSELSVTAEAATLAAYFSLSNPNRYLFPVSSAPKSVKDGRVSFTGGPDLAISDVNDAITKQGGTFNKETNKMIRNEVGLLKRHSTLSYDKLHPEWSYTKAISQAEVESEGGSIFFDASVDAFTQSGIGRGLNRRYFTATELNQAIEGRNSNILAPENIRRVDQAKAVRGVGEQGLLSAKGDDASAKMERVDEDLGLIKGDPFGPRQTALGDNVDKINILPYGKGPKVIISGTEIKDFIKFRFADVVNNKYIVFRAILSGIQDSISADYGEERYLGRPDKVYIYQGANRGINFNFKIYPKTKQEFPVLLEKLNYLVGLCYPSYTEGQRMITPFIQLTIGDMFNETPGLIESLNVTVEDSSTWEIEEGLQFPHYISVACSFKHIGKHALGSKGKHYDLPWIEDGLDWKGYPDRTKYNDMFEDLGQYVPKDEFLNDGPGPDPILDDNQGATYG